MSAGCEKRKERIKEWRGGEGRGGGGMTERNGVNMHRLIKEGRGGRNKREKRANDR